MSEFQPHEGLPEHSLCVPCWLFLGAFSVYAGGDVTDELYQCVSLLLGKYLFTAETNTVPSLL